MHPLNIELNTINVDFGRLEYLYHSHQIQCNYPEAFLHPSITFNKISIEQMEIEPGRANSDVIRSADPGNITASEID